MPGFHRPSGIILVDDGSPDRCGEICDGYAATDRRISVIHQENKGLSEARNAGTELASGEYVWYVDSDDWVEENCLEGICGELDGCDILYFNRYYESGDPAESVIIRKNDATTGKELAGRDVPLAQSAYIYRRAFLIENGLSFAEGLFHEDNLFTPVALYLAQSVKPCDRPVYHKYVNPHSISRTLHPKRCYDLMAILERLSLFAEDHVAEQDRWAWGHFIADTMNGALALALKCGDPVKEDLDAFVRSHPGLLDYLCHARKVPTRIMGLLAKNLHIPLVRLYGILYTIRYRKNRR